jgi:hypothetical protein
MLQHRPAIRYGIARDRLYCRVCPVTIVPGEAIVVYLHDGNPGGCGPARHEHHATPRDEVGLPEVRRVTQ